MTSVMPVALANFAYPQFNAKGAPEAAPRGRRNPVAYRNFFVADCAEQTQ